LNGLRCLRGLHLSNTGIRDSDLADIRDLTSLQELDLSACTNITDRGLAHLSRMVSLHDLSVRSCRIGDASLGSMARLTELRRLDLSGTRVSDVGLMRLKFLSKLREVCLVGTKVSKSGARQLSAALPSATIVTEWPIQTIEPLSPRHRQAVLEYLKRLKTQRRIHKSPDECPSARASGYLQ
jgi:hypothetical protein